MEIKIDRNSRIPLYLQIKEQFKELIQGNHLKKGLQLPTERELSLKLEVSRNTVSMAYKELAQERYVSSISGKGTFVLVEVKGKEHSFNSIKDYTFYKNIDLAIDEALKQNIQLEDFMRLVDQRFKEKKDLLNNINIAFIECNQEQLYYFSQKLELGEGINIIPILIDEMYNQRENFLKTIKSVDLVVTTFFHLQEVQDYLKDENKNIIAIALDPQIETMVKIAHSTSPEMSIGLICLTDKFAERVIISINNAGIKYTRIVFTTSKNGNELKNIIDNSDILIVSPGRMKEIHELTHKDTPLIEFVYIPDKGSIDTLKKNIIDIKKKGYFFTNE